MKLYAYKDQYTPRWLDRGLPNFSARERAKLDGKPTYLGVQCSACHGILRYTHITKNSCVTCTDARLAGKDQADGQRKNSKAA
jgi:hypothetical protein